MTFLDAEADPNDVAVEIIGPELNTIPCNLNLKSNGGTCTFVPLIIGMYKVFVFVSSLPPPIPDSHVDTVCGFNEHRDVCVCVCAGYSFQRRRSDPRVPAVHTGHARSVGDQTLGHGTVRRRLDRRGPGKRWARAWGARVGWVGASDVYDSVFRSTVTGPKRKTSKCWPRARTAGNWCVP